MARLHGHLRLGAVFHSARGSHDTRSGSAGHCAANAITRRMGKAEICFDNGAAESFLGTLKNEMCHRYTFATRNRARSAVADYIEVSCNRKRQHSTLGCRTLALAPADHQQSSTAAASTPRETVHET